jgi:hypothetical protein
MIASAKRAIPSSIAKQYTLVEPIVVFASDKTPYADSWLRSSSFTRKEISESLYTPEKLLQLIFKIGTEK